MLSKLAARNVKRQIGNYVIYFITVSLTVALMFAVNTATFNEQLLAKASFMKELKTALVTITVMVSMIVAFVLGYATSYMLKLRKREFGTYLTLGMTRKNILAIFFIESLILCVISLITGLILGLGVYQGLMAVVTNIFEMEFNFAAYSLPGFLLTVGLVLLVFLFSSLTSAFYLRRVAISALVYGGRKSVRKVRMPGLWLTVTVISLTAVVASCLVLRKWIGNIFQTGASIRPIMAALMTLAVGITLLHIGLAKSIFGFMLRSEKIKNRGTNTFVLRSLSDKANSNSVMMGVLAFLISFAIIGANFSFVLQSFNKEVLDRDYPFDITAEIDAESEFAVKPGDADGIISRFAAIENKLNYSLYTFGERYLYGFTRWSSSTYKMLKDILITESDFNSLSMARGYRPVDLKGGFCIAANSSYVDDIKNADFSSAVLSVHGKELEFTGFTEAPIISMRHFAAVVPDDFVENVAVIYHGLVYDLKDGKFDPQQLYDALTYSKPLDIGVVSIRCDFTIREYVRMQYNAQNAIFMIGALYIAFIFIFMAMAVLALKTLSDLADNRRRYGILYRVGASLRERSGALLKQTFIFFFLPFALPLLLSIPVGIICSAIMTLTGFAAAAVQTATAAAAIALVTGAVYCLYFTATYLLAKRAVIR